MREHFERLYRHLAWADEKVRQSLLAARNPPAKAVEIYGHVLGAEHVWLSRIHGEPATVAVWPSLSLDECGKLARDNVSAFDKVIAGLTLERLAARITYRNSAGDQFTSTIEDILTHVALHGSYHRGQIAASLRAAGDAPSPTDYIAFARGSPAATRKNA